MDNKEESGSQRVIPGPAVSMSPGGSLERKVLGPHSGLTELEYGGWEAPGLSDVGSGRRATQGGCLPRLQGHHDTCCDLDGLPLCHVLRQGLYPPELALPHHHVRQLSVALVL